VIVKSFILFLDRDGTIIVDRGYGVTPAEVELVPGVSLSLTEAVQLGARICVVTNQSAIGRGFSNRQTVDDVNIKMIELLRGEGVDIDLKYVFLCPHMPEDGCLCRKPNTRMFEDGAGALGLSIDGSFMIGDRESDVEAGHSAGAYSILLSGAEVAETVADYTTESITEAVAHIAQKVRNG
jgi:D-glycero-D-manno-heptose 1,7-bisphosphate phosphatase